MTEYERGLKEGRVEARLDGHDARFDKINGSIDRFSQSHENLAKAVSVGLEKLAAEIRKMQAEAHARDLAVDVAAKTLAAETERRRVEEEGKRLQRAEDLEVAPRKWSVRGVKFGIAVGCVSVIVGLTVVLSFYLAHR